MSVSFHARFSEWAASQEMVISSTMYRCKQQPAHVGGERTLVVLLYRNALRCTPVSHTFPFSFLLFNPGLTIPSCATVPHVPLQNIKQRAAAIYRPAIDRQVIAASCQVGINAGLSGTDTRQVSLWRSLTRNEGVLLVDRFFRSFPVRAKKRQL